MSKLTIHSDGNEFDPEKDDVMPEPKEALGRIMLLGFKDPPSPQVRSNPYTGIQHTLVPRAVMLYDFITTRDFTCGLDYSRRTWDLARYWFQTNWPDEYYDLLD